MLTATLTEAVNSFSQFKVREVIKIIDSVKFEKKAAGRMAIQG